MSELEWTALARAAGWLPPDEIKLRVWRAKNLRDGVKCRWCGVKRNFDLQPHKTYCRFYDGPVTHGVSGTGHYDTFGYSVNCTCGSSYLYYDTAGNKQECPDREKTWKLPRVPDLSVLDRLRSAAEGDTVADRA